MLDIYKMVFNCNNYKKIRILERCEQQCSGNRTNKNGGKTMEEIIATLEQDALAAMPGPGARDVVIEAIERRYNNIGKEVVYIGFRYTHKGQTFHWGLTYRLNDKKLNKIFPSGEILASDIGKTVKVEIGYCNSKNGEYPSILDLDD